jgi:CHASE3 domain sensor protein
MGTTICEEKRRLLETYQNATQAYAYGVEKLRRQMGTMDKPEYDALYRITEELRLGATGAREELNAHVKLHGC